MRFLTKLSSQMGLHHDLILPSDETQESLGEGEGLRSEKASLFNPSLIMIITMIMTNHHAIGRRVSALSDN